MFLDSACRCLRTIYWSQVFSEEWRYSWSSADRQCSSYIWVINSFIAYTSASYIRHLMLCSLLLFDYWNILTENIGGEYDTYSINVFYYFSRCADLTVYPKKYAHGFCFAVLCCSYTLTDFPISIRLTSLALWQSNDCPSASKATLMNMDKYFMWIHYERLHNHNKAKHNKTVCIFLGIYCM